MFLTIVYWFLAVFGYFAVGAVYHNGLCKLVNANRWERINKKKSVEMHSLSDNWEKCRRVDVTLYLMLWPIWIFGSIFTVGLIGKDD